MGHPRSKVLYLVEAAGQSSPWPGSYQETKGARNASLYRRILPSSRERRRGDKASGEEGERGRGPNANKQGVS